MSDNNNNNNNNNIDNSNNDNNNNNNYNEVDNNGDNDNKYDKSDKIKIKLMKLTSKQSTDSTLGYNETLMHEHYSPMRSIKMFKQEDQKLLEEHKWMPCLGGHSSLNRTTKLCCDLFMSRTAQDWLFLTLLGMTVAIFSFMIDLFTEKSLQAHKWLYWIAGGNSVWQFLAWVTYPVVLIAFSAGFTRFVGPTAVGSGIPEVKTIMKGVVLKEYLTFKTLIAKIIGLTASLGSGVPIGKVGPLVHVASVTASNLSKLFSAFRHIRENEALQIDILTAASAVGVSCTFAAPIGGVLFSVEATATYFAVRNYWRGFYAAMCGALTFRLLSSITKSEETLTALFRTDLRQALPFDVFEIFAFALVGLICGVMGAGFVWMHKKIVLFMRGRKCLSDILKKNPFFYPCLVTFVVFSLTFPAGVGKYMAGELTLREAVNQMFDNMTWVVAEAETIEEQRKLSLWRGPHNNVLLTIALFFFMKFWMCAFATTLPVPCGIFIPAFALGSAVGRFIGETMACWFPEGIRDKMIVPGAYSLVGAATFSGAVTHTVSPAVIVFELTGHLGHLLPCVIAVMVAGATANFLQPSVYDAMIEIKKLPFLPSRIDPDACNAHKVTAKDIMVRQVRCVSKESTYGDVFRTITEFKHRAYPVIASEKDTKLRGSVSRTELKHLLVKQLNLGLPVSTKSPSSSSLPLPSDDKTFPIDTPEVHLLATPVDFHLCNIDHSPFQITSNTSLYRIHWLFSLLSLHRAFVTEDGKVVGVLSLAEVRKAIECEIHSTR